MKKTVKTPNIKTLLTVYIGELDHFIEQAAYPCRANDQAKKDLGQLGWLEVNEAGLLARTKEPIPTDLLAAYWKFRFTEERTENNKMYNAVQQLIRAVG